MLVLLLSAVLWIGSERVDIREGRLPAPGAERCVRLHATGSFAHAVVRVNQVNAGELANEAAELDITGYLSTGAENQIEVKGSRGLWAWMSPLVYLKNVRVVGASRVEVTVVNTTENTVQVEVGEGQFTVSPGTAVSREVVWGGGRVRMRAVSDGLDREFVDEMEVAGK